MLVDTDMKIILKQAIKLIRHFFGSACLSASCV